MAGNNVCVIGMGYIGLPTAGLLASKGYRVFGVDINPKIVSAINKGEIHIVEPGLDCLISEVVLNGQLTAHLEIQEADVYIICVPTPYSIEGDVVKPDMSYVYQAAMSIAPILKDEALVILESTSPVGSTEQVFNKFVEYGVCSENFDAAYCPERVLPGRALIELNNNDRIVGGISPRATKRATDFYKSFISGAVHGTDAKTAEMVKLAENSFRDLNIAFANELSMICSDEGIDVSTLIQLANLHPRVSILNPGPGVGGHCIAVDPWFIVSRNPEKSRLIRSAREVNDYKPVWVTKKIILEIEKFKSLHQKNPKIACLGLAFKPNIDDVRESPSLEITQKLISLGFDIVAVEPNIDHHSGIKLVDLDTALNFCDIFVLLVGHNQFMLEPIKSKLRSSISIDICGMLST